MQKGYSYFIGDEDLIDGTKKIVNAEPHYAGDGIDMEPCPDPECYWHDERGFCLYESCIKDELPKMHSVWHRKCDLCRKTYVVSAPLNQPWMHLCEKCRRHLQDVVLNDWEFKCGICGAIQNGNRQVSDADICDACVNKLRAIIFYCPLDC